MQLALFHEPEQDSNQIDLEELLERIERQRDEAHDAAMGGPEA